MRTEIRKYQRTRTILPHGQAIAVTTAWEEADRFHSECLVVFVDYLKKHQHAFIPISIKKETLTEEVGAVDLGKFIEWSDEILYGELLSIIYRLDEAKAKLSIPPARDLPELFEQKDCISDFIYIQQFAPSEIDWMLNKSTSSYIKAKLNLAKTIVIEREPSE